MAKQPQTLDEIPEHHGPPEAPDFYPVCGAARLIHKNGSEILGFIAYKDEFDLFFSGESGFIKNQRVVDYRTLDSRLLSDIAGYISIKISLRGSSDNWVCPFDRKMLRRGISRFS